MATLALSVVGFAVGGPLGASLGALAGQQIDALVFGGGPPRDGPRLSDLAVQTSSYGTQIPRIYGRMRVAGTVIWASDLVESRQTQGAKGQPDLVTYSYAASFAVALSSRPIVSVGRIWADGLLIRGSDNNLKVDGRLRIHDGRSDNVADPLIAAAEQGRTPAHRGLAHAVFEDLQLADFGNRIPSITFEVIADAAPPDAVEVLADLGGILPGPGLPELPLDGYAASGGSRRTAIEPLAALLPLHIADAGDGRLRAQAATSADPPLLVEPLRESGAGRIDDAAETTDPVARLPQFVAIRHHDPARDYQVGLQQVDAPGADGIGRSLDLPAAVGADRALTLAAQLLQRSRRERRRWRGSVALPPAPLMPGGRMRIDGETGRIWRATGIEHEAGRLIVEAVADSTAALPAANPGSGRALLAPDLAVPPTHAVLVELPSLTPEPARTPRLAVAAAGTAAGWRGATAALLRGEALLELGSLPRGAVTGTALMALPPASPWLEDRSGTVDVALAGPHLLLADADADRLATGRNRAMLGRECLQFGRATPLGGGRWRLGDLRRGLAGTDAAVTAHAAGEPFLLLDPPAWIDPGDQLAAGTTLAVAVAGLSDAQPLHLSLQVDGTALRPPAPVHGRARRDGGRRRFAWQRRSRVPAPWADFVDMPLGEEREAYRLRWLDGDGLLLGTAETGHPGHDLPADLPPSGQLEVVQIGSAAPSLPLVIRF